jgi:hypothetical protein
MIIIFSAKTPNAARQYFRRPGSRADSALLTLRGELPKRELARTVHM